MEGRFELEFVEVEPSCLQEAVLEVVEVEEDVRLVEGFLGIALAEVEPDGTLYLHGRQGGNGASEQFTLMGIVATSSLATAFQSVEEGLTAKVSLQVSQAICVLGNNLGNRQSCFGKMSGQVAEGVVLVATCSDGPDERTAVAARQAVVAAIAACSGNGFCADNFKPGGFLIEFLQFFHIRLMR